jgi:hypothetical protein
MNTKIVFKFTKVVGSILRKPPTNKNEIIWANVQMVTNLNLGLTRHCLSISYEEHTEYKIQQGGLRVRYTYFKKYASIWKNGRHIRKN